MNEVEKQQSPEKGKKEGTDVIPTHIKPPRGAEEGKKEREKQKRKKQHHSRVFDMTPGSTDLLEHEGEALFCQIKNMVL